MAKALAMIKRYPWLLGVAVVILVCLWPLLWRLNACPVVLWDEARFASSAVEMVKSGDLLVTTYDGQPDLWNTKPPLAVWLEAASLKIFNFRGIAVRLPAAGAALATVGLLLYFAIKVLNKPWMGYIGSVVLVSSLGFVDTHVARTGDADIFLVLGTTVYALAFFAYIIRKKSGDLVLAVAGLLVAVMAKGVAGLFGLPGLFIFLLISGEKRAVFKDKRFYFALLIILGVIVAYYLARELAGPGYLAAVWQNELGGRYLAVQEGHQNGFWYYFSIMPERLGYLWYLLPLGVFTSWLSKDAKIRQFSKLVLVFALSFLLVISLAQTKIHWYVAPVIPLLCLFIGLFLTQLWQGLSSYLDIGHRRILKYTLLALLLFGFLFTPYQKMLGRVGSESYVTPLEKEGAFMRVVRQGLPNEKEFTVIKKVPDPAYLGQILFYAQLWQRTGGYKIRIATDVGGDLGPAVLSCQEDVLAAVAKKYKVEKLTDWAQCQFLRISR